MVLGGRAEIRKRGNNSKKEGKQQSRTSRTNNRKRPSLVFVGNLASNVIAEKSQPVLKSLATKRRVKDYLGRKMSFARNFSVLLSTYRKNEGCLALSHGRVTEKEGLKYCATL